MPIHKPHQPHHTNAPAEDPEPGLLPVDPDQGPVPANIPADPEHDRVIDPEA